MSRARNPFIVLTVMCLAALLAPHGGTSRANVPFNNDAKSVCAAGDSGKKCSDRVKSAKAACHGLKDADCQKEYSDKYDAYRKTKTDPKQQIPQFHASESYDARDPKGLTSGLSTDYQPMSVPASSIAPDSFLAFREQDRAAALASTKPAKGYSAHPEYLSDGAGISSCAEYVYKKFLDWSKYEDQIFACREDKGCMYDVATASLAHKTLKDAAGVPLPSMNWWRKTSSSTAVDAWPQALPKNPFFAIELPGIGYDANGKAITGPDGKPQDPVALILPDLAKDLPEIRAILASAGGAYYTFGKAAKPGQSFADEWDFHAKMRELVRPVPDAVADEMYWRTQKLEGLLAKIGVFVWSAEKVDHDSSAASQNPLQMLGPDPFVRLATYEDLGEFSSRYSAALKSYAGASRAVAVPMAPEAQSGRIMSHMQLASGWRKDPANPRRFLCTPETTMVTFTSVTNGVSKKTVTGVLEQCEAWNMLFEEYDRLVRNRAKGCTAASNCGCLHVAKAGETSSYGCDWSLDKFAGRWVAPNHFVKDRSQDWNQCHRLYEFAGPATGADKANLASFEKKLQVDYDHEKTWLKLPSVDPKQLVLSFGDDHASSAHVGDPATFSVGYAYDAGWQLEPIAVVPDTDLVCQMSGRAWGSFDIDAKIMKWDLKIVDAAAWIVANKPSKDKPLGSGKVDYGAHFTVLGLQLFNPIPVDLPKIPNPGMGGYHFKKDDPESSDGDGKSYATHEFNQAIPAKGSQSHPDIDIPDPPFSATILIGPVPVTAAAGGGLSFGAKIQPKVSVPDKCEKEIKSFGVDLVFKPSLNAGAFISGGVGVPGCEVDIRADVTLLDIGLPVTAGIGVGEHKGKLELDFGVGVDAVLSTLGGKVSLEFQFLLWDEKITLFKWSGLGPYTVEILPDIKGTYPLPELGQYVRVVCTGANPGKNPVCNTKVAAAGDTADKTTADKATPATKATTATTPKTPVVKKKKKGTK